MIADKKEIAISCLPYYDETAKMKKSVLILAICCFGFLACATISRDLFPYLQVKWPSNKVPADQLVVGKGSSLTIELKTNIENIEGFFENQKAAVSLNYITTLHQEKKSDYSIGRPWARRASGTITVTDTETEETKLFDLIMPAFSTFGLKKLAIVGAFAGGQDGADEGKIKRTIDILYEPERLDDLACDFIRNWWSLEEKSVRFFGNTVRWRNEVPGLNTHIQKTANILSRWWSEKIRFIEDPINPDVIIKQGDKYTASSLANMDSEKIVSGAILVPLNASYLPEEAVLLFLAHEFGHCLGIAIAVPGNNDHPSDDSFMGGGRNASLRCHPYQQRAAYLVYTHPAGTKF
jgi:hypothetical protein